MEEKNNNGVGSTEPPHPPLERPRMTKREKFEEWKGRRRTYRLVERGLLRAIERQGEGEGASETKDSEVSGEE